MRNAFGKNVCDTDTLALKIVLHASKPFVPVRSAFVSIFIQFLRKEKTLTLLEECKYFQIALGHTLATLCRAKPPALPRHTWSATYISLFISGKDIKSQ